MENSNAQNFVVYAEWWEAISMLSNEQKGVLFQAMFSTSTGQCAMPEMDTSTKMAFLLIRPRIVAAQEKYAAKVRILFNEWNQNSQERKCCRNIRENVDG